MRSKRRSKVREKMREESMTERKRRERVRKHGDQREEEKERVLSRSKYLLHYTLLCVAPSDIIAHDSHKTSMV